MHLLTTKTYKKSPPKKTAKNSPQFIIRSRRVTVLSFARVYGIGVVRHGSEHRERTGSDFGVTQNFSASIRACCRCVSERRGGLAQSRSL